MAKTALGVWLIPGLATVLAGASPAQSWQALSGLPARQGHVLAAEPNGRIWLHGGQPPDVAYPFEDLFQDLWRFDASGWQPVAPATRPSPRLGHGLVYDSQRQRLLLFGGVSSPPNQPSVVHTDTWTFDGVDWQQLPVAGPQLAPVAMAFDSSRGRTVLLGEPPAGGLPVTYEFDGAAWQSIATAASPPSGFHRLAYVAQRQRTVAITAVGLVPTPALAVHEYDGSTWQVRNASGGPLSRANAAVTVDGLGRVVLFGGNDNSVAFADTWAWDGTAWQLLAPASQGPAPSLSGSGALAYDAPGQLLLLVRHDGTFAFLGGRWSLLVPPTGFPARYGAVVVADRARDRLMVLGGLRPGIGSTAEHWEWDGAVWQLLPQAVPLPPAWRWLGCHDAARQRTVLVAHDPQGSNSTTTVEFDGTAWHQPTLALQPPAPVQALTYDATHRRCLAYAASTSWTGAFAQTWAYDGQAWQLLASAVQPPPRAAPALAHDPTRRTTVLYGGGNGGAGYADTWELVGDQWSQRNPQIRPGPWFLNAAFDTAAGRVVLPTPATGPVPAGLHEFDGNHWLPIAAGEPPPQWLRSTFVDDGRGHQLRMVSPQGDVYGFDRGPVARWARVGAPCRQGLAPELRALGLPSLGGQFAIQVSGLPASGSALLLAYGFGIDRWLGTPLPIGLSPFGLPDCDLWLAPSGDSELLWGISQITRSYSLPAAPILAGVRVALQGFGLDPTSPAGLSHATNAGLATLH